jgi:hypothetical protein
VAESVQLDPAEVALSGRVAVDITPVIQADTGVDWGDAAISQYQAEAERGQMPVDFRVPNRTVTIPLVITQRGTVTFETWRSWLQHKASLFQTDGGHLRRITNGGGTVFADVVNASLKLGGGWGQAHKGYDVEGQLVLECIPDFYGAEVEAGSDTVQTTLNHAIKTVTGVQGNYPARVRVAIDNDQATDQLGCVWGFRSKHYSNAATAALVYEAEALTNLDNASDTAVTGATGGTVVQHNSLPTAQWTPVLSTQHASSGHMTHTGTYRVLTRCRTTSTSGSVSLRFVYSVGDLTAPAVNTQDVFEIPVASAFFMADLGEIRLERSAAGTTHRWLGQWQAYAQNGATNVQIDQVIYLPADTADGGGGRLVAPPRTPATYTAYTARDTFDQSAGALTGKTATLGGTWVGAGDTDDGSVEATGHTVVRSNVSDTGGGGRFWTLNLNLTDTVVQVDFKRSTVGNDNSPFQGVLARWADVNNHVWATVSGIGSFRTVRVNKIVGGVGTSLLLADNVGFNNGLDWSSLRLMVLAHGYWEVQGAFFQGGPFFTLGSGADPALATGGTLATGDPGFTDGEVSSFASTRSYDNFAVWVPPTHPAAFASRSLEVATKGASRQDTAGGSVYTELPLQGPMPRLPVAGIEGRSTETIVKLSRGDLDLAPDSGIDDLSFRLFYRPCWLTVPS